MRESRLVTARRKRGLFVTFEGIEGSGKTTQLRLLAGRLRRLGIPILVTRQPGGTPAGARLRRLLLHAGSIDPRAELLLMFADRRQHLTESIEPALAAGTLVLCDRYTDASRAYQGAGRRLGEDLVDLLHSRFCEREPDRTYLFDCPPETGLARVAASREGKDRIEREVLAFHRRVRAAYLDRARREPGRILVLDGTRPREELAALLASDLDALRPAR
jgi:dTMP kinase